MRFKSQDLTQSIVRVLSPSGVTVGTGFVVHRDGLIATCAHVVQACKAGPGGIVRLAFHATGEEREAIVEQDWWRDPGAEDVAILRLRGPLPDGVKPLPLGSSRHSRGHDFFSLGYRLADAFPSGLVAEGKIQDRIRYRTQDVLQLLSSQIDHGMSGAPLWDALGHRVVGMINAFWETTRHQDAWLALAIPTETLRTVCPLLQLSDLCPYRGLEPFTEADAEFFFGRERAVEHLLERLRQEPRFLAVLGPSGSGKSSLVRAGLIPRLRQGAVPHSDRWDFIVIRPGRNPFGELEAEGLSDASQGLVEAVRNWQRFHPEAKRLALALDQFEELLVDCPEETRREFVAQLAALLDSPLPITVILVMRDDFYSRFAREARPLVKWLERGLANVPLTLEPNELRAIVEEPARAVGLALEEGLADVIVREVLEATPQGAPGTILPLLEFALTGLWERREEGLLTHAAYRAIGRVTGGLTQWADSVLSRLDEEQRRLARRVLTDLVHLGNESRNIPDSRRRRTLDELCRYEGEREAVHQVVRLLADARLLVTGRDLSTGQETIELIHDALLREWGQLRGWLQEDRRFLTWQQTLEERVKEWQNKGKDEGLLLRGAMLTEAERWLAERPDDLNPDKQDYIRKSVALWEREQTEQERRRRQFTVAAMVATIVLMFLAILAWSQRNQALQAQVKAEMAQATAVEEARVRATAQAVAEIRRQEAEDQRQIAVSRQLIAQAQLLHIERGNLVTPILLAVEALKRSSNWEAGLLLQRVLDHLQKPLARLNHEGEVVSAVFSLDNRLLFTTTNDGTTYIWDWRAKKVNFLLRHTEPVKRIILRPDGQILASVTERGVHFWEVRTGQEIREIGSVRLLEFSPDWHWMAAVQDDATSVTIWDLFSWQPIARLTCSKGNGYVYSLIFSPDSHWLAANIGSAVCVWDVIRGEEKVTVRNDNPRSRAAEPVFSPDSKLMAIWWFDGDHSVEVWDVSTGREVAKMVYDEQVRLVKFTPDSTRLVVGKSSINLSLGRWGRGGSSGGIEKTIEIWGGVKDWHKMTVTEAPLGDIFEFHPNPKVPLAATGQNDEWVYVWNWQTGQVIRKIDMSQDIDRVAWVSTDKFSNWIASVPAWRPCHKHRCVNALEVWDIFSGQSIAQFPGTSFSNHSYNISSDGKYAVEWDYGGNTTLIWELVPKEEVALTVKSTSADTVSKVLFSPDGKWMAASTFDRVFVWKTPTIGSVEAGTWQPEKEIGGGDVIFSPDSRLIVSSFGSSVRVWEVATGREISRMSHEDRVNDVDFSPDGHWIVSGSDDHTARVWEVATGRELARVTHNDLVSDVSFNSDGRIVISAGWDKTAILWEAASGKKLARFESEDIVTAAEFSPDGHLALTAGNDGIVHIWDVVTLREKARLDLTRPIKLATFSPNGKWILTVDFSGRTRVWEAETGQLLAEIWQPSSIVLSATFSPDGHRIGMAGGYTNEIRVVLWHPEDLIAEACSRLTRNLTRGEWRLYLGDEPYRPTCPNLPVPEE